MNSKKDILSIIFVLFLSFSDTLILAHGSRELPMPTEAQLQGIALPVPGAAAFAEELAVSAKSLFSQPNHALLDEVQNFYAQAAAMEQKHSDERTARQAAYFRGQAEEHLVELAEQIPAAIAITVDPEKPFGETADALTMSGQEGVVLMKITTGGDARRFSVQTLNLRREGPPEKTPLTILTSGVTYLLLRLEEIPSDRSIHLLTFRGDNDQTIVYRFGLHLERVPLGQLKLTVLDENQKITPVLVRLTARSDGRLFELPNAIDLAPIMHSITSPGMTPEVVKNCYGPGRGFQYYIPGAFGGRYWVVPGEFEMALPEGEYILHINRGPEYVPFNGFVKIAAQGRSTHTYTLKRWEDMKRRGWYSGDDHVHARLMSSEDAFKLLTCAKATDVQVSNILEMGNETRTWYAQRGFGKAFRVQDGDYVLVPGQEDPRSALGHIIGLNLKSLVRDLDRYLQNDWIADQIHAQGGLYGVTHVGEKACLAHRDLAMSVPQGKADFTSILQNIIGTEWYYDFLNLGYRVVASAGSDTPYGGFVGSVRVYAYIGKDAPFTADGWFDAFAAGKTFVTNGPMLELAVDDKLPGEEIVLDAPRTVHVKARAWGIAGLTAPTSLKIVVLSDVVKEMQLAALDGDLIAIETDIECPYGAWIAAHAVGQNGFGAHTTPVYVRREGFRHWNTQKADEIIRRQLGILDEIEAMIVEVETRQNAGGLLPLDYWNRQIAAQAAPLRQRITAVRAIYDELKQTLKKEKTIRQKSL